MLVGVLLNFLVPDQVFIWVTSVALIGTLWTWAIIVLAHLGYRKAVDAGRARRVSFRMPGAPLANWLVVGFLIVVAALLSIEPATRVALRAMVRAARGRLRPDETQGTTKHEPCCWTVAFAVAAGQILSATNAAFDWPFPTRFFSRWRRRAALSKQMTNPSSRVQSR
jgi:hypothetical protein